LTEGVPSHSSRRPPERATAIPNASTRDRGGTRFEANFPSTISAQPYGADRHEKTDRESPSQMTHPTIHFAIRCPSTLHTETGRKPAHICGPILADKNGGRSRSQNCFPNSVRIVRVFGHAVRTHQRTCNFPSRDESYPMPTPGRMRGGVPGRHSHLLADMQQYVEHLRHVFEILRRERFYVKLSKSDFALEKVQFLGHIVSAQGVHVDPKKIKAVRTWKSPENVKELQQFLGFANYYNRFVPQYAKLAAPLTNLLKKNTPYKWEPQTPGGHPERDYVIEADASDQAVGAVLMQEQRNELQPIAYLSKKLHGAELNYPLHDKKTLAIIIAFKTWRCYVEGRKTTVYTDHCSLKYLKTQPSLSRRQVRWIDFLETHFHYDIVYKPGHKNKADALSRPAHVSPSKLKDESTPQGTLHTWRHLLQWDNDITYRKGSMKVWVPNYPPLRQLLLEEYHDVLYADTTVATKRSMVSPNTTTGPHGRCRTEICHLVHYMSADEEQQAEKGGSATVLPVSEQPWQVVSLDFITGLPTTTSGHDAILVVIDKFSKMGHFIPTHTTARTEETAQLFVCYIISQHGIPTTLISNRDPKLNSKFWKELMSLLGTKLAMSSAYHPKTDGQTERLNQIVEQLLHTACKDDISKWDLHLPVLEFASTMYSRRYWTDAVLPLLRTPPTHTSTANHTSHSPSRS
ncbi:hypothetical protein CLOM_g17696, partial [Closterium sp. NIES-68]